MTNADGNTTKPPTAETPRGRVQRVERDSVGRLRAWIEGHEKPVEDVRVARCFPWSLPEAYVSIRSKDGKEICLLSDLAQLDAISRSVIEKELHDKVFNPRILRVLEARREFDVTSFRVETDRGEVTFQIRSREDVRALSPTRALFRDVDGNTYELPDVGSLDPVSRRHVMDYF